jgi:hypothetical protein
MPGILAGLEVGYQKPAKKHKVEKSKGEKSAHGGSHTQVGELDDELKEPTPAMKITKAAQEEKHYATRDWIAGRISTRKHNQIHARAKHAIKNAHKY